MKINYKKVGAIAISALLPIFVLTTIVFPTNSFAQNGGTGGSSNTQTNTNTTGNNNTANTNTSSTGLNFKIPNPIKAKSITELISFILKLLFKIGIPLIVIFFLWAGFKFILAKGNPSEIKTAKSNLWHVVIGTAIFLGAYAIADIIVNTVKNTTGYSPLE